MTTFMERDPATVERHRQLIEQMPQPVVFVTLSGSHLYGFSSADSDWDLRGSHAMPADAMLGLDAPRSETFETRTYRGGAPQWRQPAENARGLVATNVLDELVSHDALKFFRLLLKNNGYVLEQLYSPIMIFDGGHLDELREIARGCITSQHALHYHGFGYGEWTKFVNNPTKTVKRVLYVFRVLMSGIWMMRTGEVQSNIVDLNEYFRLPYIEPLIEQKRAGYEQGELAAGHGLDFYTREYERLMDMLKDAARGSHLPQMPSLDAKAALNDLLLRLRRTDVAA